MAFNIDIIEQNILEYNRYLLDILLQDHTTGENIRWATDDYEHLGELYRAEAEIFPNLITGSSTNVIQPRVAKAAAEQSARTRSKAEVFTPSWICNEQNNLVDDSWFGRQNVFNTPVTNDNGSKGWIVNSDVIEFPDVTGKSWKDYVDARRMEISCGEAPYLVSRYDTVSGRAIPVNERIGLLDRKLRVISENVDEPDLWFKWAVRAYESIYGFEYQGDNVLLARENLLYTFIDNYAAKFGEQPSLIQTKSVATKISWNIWQMDGITMTAPYSKRENAGQISFALDALFSGATEEDDIYNKADTTAIPCVIMDWRSKVKVVYKDMLTGGSNGR